MDQILRGLCLAVRAVLSGLHPMLLASDKLFIHCKAQEAQDRAGFYSSPLTSPVGNGLPEWHMIPSPLLLEQPGFTFPQTQS